MKNTALSISDVILPVRFCIKKRPMKYAKTIKTESHAVRYTAIIVIKSAIKTMPSRT